MSYNLFLDDKRNPPSRSYVLARSTRDAMAVIKANGLPGFMSLDHDLGFDDSGREDNGMMFVKSLQNLYPYGPVPGVVVHSSNPPGRENIVSFIESWRRFCQMPVRRWDLPFGVLLEVHHPLCSCSYCTSKEMNGVGLALPRDKSRNSWRVIHIKIAGRSRIYARWTLSASVNKIFNWKAGKK